jgi:hypothetical protein
VFDLARSVECVLANVMVMSAPSLLWIGPAAALFQPVFIRGSSVAHP